MQKNNVPRIVEVKDSVSDDWVKRIFLKHRDDGGADCVTLGDEDKYLSMSSQKYRISEWDFMREIGEEQPVIKQKEEITRTQKEPEPRAFIAELLLIAFIGMTVLLLWDAGIFNILRAFAFPSGLALGAYWVYFMYVRGEDKGSI